MYNCITLDTRMTPTALNSEFRRRLHQSPAWPERFPGPLASVRAFSHNRAALPPTTKILLSPPNLTLEVNRRALFWVLVRVSKQ